MCGANLDDYLHLLVHHIVKCFDTKDNPLDLKRCVCVCVCAQCVA